MRGADGVRDQLALLLASEMPRKIPLLRQARGWDSQALPDVDRFVSGDAPDEVISANRGNNWVVVVNPRLLRMTQTGDYSPLSEPEYHLLYSCKVFLWANGRDWDGSIAARDHLAETARSCLVQYPTLSTDPGDTGYRLNVETYTEDFGVPSRSPSGQRCWAAAMLGVDVIVEEFLDDGSTLPALGTADTIAPDTYAVGFTQPMNGED